VLRLEIGEQLDPAHARHLPAQSPPAHRRGTAPFDVGYQSKLKSNAGQQAHGWSKRSPLLQCAFPRVVVLCLAVEHALVHVLASHWWGRRGAG
jgi:hypothetical protein